MGQPIGKRLAGAMAALGGADVSKALPGVPTSASTPYSAQGVSGQVVVGGFVQSQERDARLTSPMKWQTYADVMANCSIVAAGTRYFLNLVAKAGWKVDPVDDTPKAREYADKMEDILDDMDTPWYRIARRAAMYRFYGFSAQEWIAKKRKDGMIGLLDIESRPQATIERWDLGPTGKLAGIAQRSPQTGEILYLPRGKLLYMVDDALTDSPEGVGLMRHLVGSHQRLRRFEQLEGWGYEGDIRGIPVGRAPIGEMREAIEAGTITAEEANKEKRAVLDFIEGHIKDPTLGLLLDSGTYRNLDDAAAPSSIYKYDMELLRGEGGPHSEIAGAIQRVNTEMARILGVEHLLLGSDGSGSLALGKEKTHNFYLLVDGSLREIRDTSERDILHTIWDLNGFPDDMFPTLKHEPVQFRDIEQITTALRDMATAGAVLAPDDPAINEVRDLMGLQHATVVDARWPAQASATVDEGAAQFDADGNPLPVAPHPAPAPAALPGARPGLLPGQNPPGAGQGDRQPAAKTRKGARSTAGAPRGLTRTPGKRK